MLLPDRIKTPESFWQSVKALGIRPSAVLQQAGLPLGIVDRAARMSTGQLFALWRALEVLGGPDVGHSLMTAVRQSTMPPSFLVAFHAKNLGDALERVARFKGLCAPETIQVAVEGEECMLTTDWPYAAEPQPHSLIDASFTFLVGVARAGTGTKVAPKKLELPRSHSDRLARWFGCPIAWQTKQARLIWRKDDLSRPFETYNRELLELLDAQLDQQMAAHQARPSVADQVRWHLRRCLTAGQTELRHVAFEMSMSERSLQRRLQEEGHRFQELLSDTRHQLALEYLHQPDFDIAEIAYLLGYENRGSFYRAFQKWECQTPRAWRQALTPRLSVHNPQ